MSDDDKRNPNNPDNPGDENDASNGDDKEKAAELKKLCKADPQLNTVYFQCTTA